MILLRQMLYSISTHLTFGIKKETRGLLFYQTAKHGLKNGRRRGFYAKVAAIDRYHQPIAYVIKYK